MRALGPGVESLEERTLLTYNFGFVNGFGAFDLRALAIATDSAGSAYVTGAFRGTADFDPSPGTTNLTSTGDHDLFVAKYASTGALLWAKSMPGGNSGSVGQGNAIVVDATGHVVITGEYAGTVNFNPSGTATNLSSPGHFDVFVAKLNADGSLAWAVDVPGSPNCVDSGNALAMDSGGNILVAGNYADTATFGSTVLTTGDSANMFVAKLSTAGSFLWAKGAGSAGQANSGATGIAVDSSGRVDVTGFFAGTVNFNAPNLANPSPLTANGIRDIFLAQWDASGNLVWNKGIGGSDFDEGMALTVDTAGNLYTTGGFSGTVDFDPGAGALNLTSGGDYSAYAAKYTSTGQLGWARAFAITAGSALGTGIAIDSSGNVDTTGWFENTVDFDPNGGSANLTSAGTEDVYVSELDPSGNYLGAQSAGSWDFDVASGIAVTGAGAILVAGGYIGTPTFGTTVLANYGRRDGFVALLSTGGSTGLSAPSAPALEAASDTGSSSSDDITSATLPVFDVTTAGASNTVELMRNGQLVASRTGPGPITDPGPIPEGQATYTARQRDNSAHISPLSTSLVVTFDRTAPATPAPPALAAADDSGTLGDGITNVRQPHLVGSTEAGALVQIVSASNVVLGSTTAAADGSYSAAFASTLADGTYSIRVQAQDAAGNSSAPSGGFSLTIDATPPATPAAPALLASDDSGTQGDGITNVRQPHLIGSVPAGLTVQIVNAASLVLGTATAAADGSYSVTIASPMADGSYALSARVQDASGNTSQPSTPLSLTIDATPPATPAAPAILAADDSGTVGDGITDVRQPHLVGTTEANALVQLVNGTGTVLASATAAASGAYSVTFASAMADGTYSLGVRAQDAAGNTSTQSAPLSLTIDSTAPAPPSTPALLAADDSGAQGDGLTNVRQPHLTGTAEAGATVTLMNAAGNPLGTAIASPAGAYSISPANTLADGSYVFHVQAQDAAGNVSAASGTLSLTIDGTMPATPATPQLLAADDTGTLGDGITTVRQPHLVGTAEALATVQIIDAGGHVQGSAAATSNGSYSVQFASPLADGTYIVRVQAQDAAGNTSSASATFTLTIGSGGQAILGTPALLAADDSGTVGDLLTNIRQPRLTGSAISGARIRLLNAANTLLGSTTAAVDGSYTVSFSSALADGSYVLHVQSLDSANNVTGASPNFTLTIDTTTPLAPAAPSLLPADDTGTLGDGITRIRQPHLTGTAEPGATVQIIDMQGNVLGTAVAAANGGYSVLPVNPLADSPYSLRARAVDAAGNMSAPSLTLSLTIDTTPPATPTAPLLAAADDSGAQGDLLTNVTQPHLTGTCEPGALVQVIDAGGNTLGSATATAGGSYSVRLASALSTGLHALRVVAQDAAGNSSSASVELDITIDTTPPNPPTTPIILGIDDTGLTGDGLTSVRQPRLIGLTEARALVQIVGAGGAVLGSAAAGGDGTYIVSFASPLPDGTYIVYVQAQDIAGNTSSPSATLSLRIDATAPVTPAIPALLPADDSGTLGDGRTSVRQPHLIGTVEANAKVQIIDLAGVVMGSGTATTNGSYSVQFASVLALSSYSVRVQAQDAAGNTSSPSASFALTIVSSIPPTPAAPTLLASDDTGKLGDNITSVRQPHLVGTTLPGLTVDLLGSSGTVLASATAAGDGSYVVQYPTALANGTITLQVRVHDSAGNTSATSAGLRLSLVTTPGDYDGDGKADLASFEPSTATWSTQGTLGATTTRAFGAPHLDIPVPADYDGTGKLELAVFRPTTAQWFILGPSGGRSVSFGGPGDIPVPGDYDGDGKADIAVYRPSTAEWFVMSSSAGPFRQQFGAPGDTPVPSDYDGDGKTDIAVFRSSTAKWYELRSTAGPIGIQFGAPGLDLPMPADFDADGKADTAVYRPTTAQWFVLRSSAGGMSRSFGAPNLDVPIPADFDGDGIADVAVYRPTTAQWLVWRSTTGPKGQTFGTPNADIPLFASIGYRMQAVQASAGARAAVFASDSPIWVVLPASDKSKAQASDAAIEEWPGWGALR